MCTAQQGQWLWSSTPLALLLAMSPLFSSVAFGQASAGRADSNIAQQIDRLVADLKRQLADLAKLDRQIEENSDSASAAMAERELSRRRDRFRREVSELVQVVAAGSDAGVDVTGGKAQRVLMEILAGHDRVLRDPASEVHLQELADHSVNFLVRA